MTIEVQPVPEVVLASEFPSLADRPAGTYNAKAAAWAASENAMAESVREIALVTKHNAEAAQEAAETLADPAVQQVVENIPAIIAAPTNAANAANSAAQALAHRNDAAASAASAAAIVWDGATGLPKSRPTLNLDFANGRHLDPRITFTRASAATYFDAMGVLRTAAAGEPRFDYDPATGESLGLLVEGQATNLVTYSSQPENWGKEKVDLTPSSVISPDGVSPMGLMTENGETAAHYATRPATFESGKTYTASVFAKEYTAGSKRYLTVLLTASGAFDKNYRVIVDLSNGSIQTVNSPVHANAEHVGNGIYRVSVTATAIGSAATLVQFRLSRTNTSVDDLTIYEGDGVSGLYIWGAQLEEGTAPTSYIKTEASQVTRAAELADIELGDWYNLDEGTLVIDAPNPGTTVSRGMLTIFNPNVSGSIPRIQVQRTSSNRTEVAVVNDAGVIDTPSLNSGPSLAPKTAIGIQDDNVAVSTGGNPVAIDNTVAVPRNVTQLRIGALFSSRINAHVRSVTYYPRRLPDAELIALTSL